MTKDEVINALKLAQEALHMATLPFPIDDVKTLRALRAVDDVINTMPLFNTWQGLTEQQRNDIEDDCEMIIGKPAFDAIEAKLKELNT